MLLLSVINMSHTQAQTVQLSLKEALNFALKNNVTVKKARLEAEKGKEKTAEIRSDAYPQISANGSLNDNFQAHLWENQERMYWFLLARNTPQTHKYN